MWSPACEGLSVGRAFTLSLDSGGADQEPAAASPTEGAQGHSADLDAGDNLGGGDSAAAPCLREERLPCCLAGLETWSAGEACSRGSGPCAGESLVPEAPCPSQSLCCPLGGSWGHARARGLDQSPFGTLT